MKTLKLGIVGTCRRGALADRNLTKDDNVEFVAGMDVNTHQLERFKQRIKENHGNEPALYLDLKEMIAKHPQLDGVFVTSPDFTHEEHAATLLEARINVYLEKPMAITIAGCDRLLETAKRQKTKLMLGHNMRYMSFTNKMKEIIDSGMIGEVKAIWCRHFVSYGGDAYFRDWHAEQDKATSLLLQKGAHDIDIIHWLAGGYTRRVSGMGNLSVYNTLPRREKEPEKPIDVTFNAAHWPPLEQKDFNKVINIEDHSMILMQLDNGVQASYQQCHYTPDACRNYTVIGTRGRIENYGDHTKETTIEVWTKRKDAFRLQGDVTFRTPPGEGTHGGSDTDIVRGFTGMLRGEHKPVSTPQAARYSVAAGCQGAESMRNGNIGLDIEPLPRDIEQYDYSK